MLDFNDLYFFARVVEHRGITAAARALDLPKSNLSRRILALEASLGARLIHRTSRRFEVTEVGEELHRHALAMLEQAEAAENVVRRRTAEPSGMIRFTCSIGFTYGVMAQLIPRFLALYPRVRLIQDATNRSVDPIHERFDICLRAHSTPLPDSTLIQRPLAEIPWHLFASPGYLARKGMPAEPADLGLHDGIAVSARQEGHAWHVLATDDARRELKVPFEPLFESNDMATLKAAASSGVGIVALPGYMARAEVSRGELRRVLPQWIAGIATLSLLMPSRRGLLPSVRSFADFLAKEVPPAVSDAPAATGPGSVKLAGFSSPQDDRVPPTWPVPGID
jgi:DNA-binding transcriptional LysR family regulator